MLQCIIYHQPDNQTTKSTALMERNTRTNNGNLVTKMITLIGRFFDTMIAVADLGEGLAPPPPTPYFG